VLPRQITLRTLCSLSVASMIGSERITFSPVFWA
jgi:hypothetical protein